MNTPSGKNFGTFAVSAAILFLLGMQTAATFGVFSERLWPFLKYPMYAKAHLEGEAVHQYVVLGRREDSSEVEIRAEDLGQDFWKFHYGPVSALLAEDISELRKHAAIYEKKFSRRLSALTLADDQLHIKGNSIVQSPRVIVKTLSLAPETGIKR